MLLQHMSFGVAAHTYTALAIGDALLSQLPAFLLSTAAGILVTRSNTQQDALTAILGRQLTEKPEPFYIVFGFLLVLGLFLHLTIVVFGLAGLALWVGWRISRRPKPSAQAPAAAKPAPPPPGTELPDPLGITIGYGLLALADPAQGGDLMSRLHGVIDRLSRELGFALPMARVRDDLSLNPNQYRVRIRSMTIGQGQVFGGYELVMRLEPPWPPGSIEAPEPIYGLPAVWVPAREVTQVVAQGHSTTPPSAVIAAHVKTLLVKKAYLLFDRQALQSYLEKARRADKAVVDDLIPGLLPVGVVHKVLQNLLREGIPIADAVTILEALADSAPGTNHDPIVLTERVRLAMASTIRAVVFSGGDPALITLDESVQSALEQAMRTQGPEPTLNLGGDLPHQLIRALKNAQAKVAQSAALLVSPQLRPFVARWLEGWLPDLPVLSFSEIDPTQQYATLRVSL
jgi:flagellar biosynthesis protein FlhA